ncbi:aldo/keto reductase [Clostridium sp.]|uniref:aldo/keto reductase n=1 Tax=Clostridium sp. TaxID=1506 RepID=UPI003D6D769E
MKYMEIGKSKIKVPRITLGAMGMGGGAQWQSDDSVALKTIDTALDIGINYIDTAPVYGMGHSEELLGKALKGRRERVILSTKCSLQWRNREGVFEYERDGLYVYRNLSKKSIKNDLEVSLKRLRTDYIDIFITHRQSDVYPVEETMEALLEMKKEGKIRAIGISNSNPDHLEDYLKYGQVDLVQDKYSILDRKLGAEYLPSCEKNGVTFQAFSMLERGLLTGKIGMDYLVKPDEARNVVEWFEPSKRILVLQMLEGWANLCEKYNCSMTNLVTACSLAESMNFSALVGVRRPESIIDAVKAMDIELDVEDFEKMKSDADVVVAASHI